MATIFITKEANWINSYNVEIGDLALTMSEEKMEAFLEGFQGNLSDINRTHFNVIPFEVILSVSVSITNYRGNYGTWKSSHSPNFYHEDRKINWAFTKAGLQNHSSWNLFGYLLSRGMVSKQDLTKNQFDTYQLIIR